MYLCPTWIRVGSASVDSLTPTVAFSLLNHGPDELTTDPAPTTEPSSIRTPTQRAPSADVSKDSTRWLKRTSMPSRRHAESRSVRQVLESRWPQPCSYTAEKAPWFVATSLPSSSKVGNGSGEMCGKRYASSRSSIRSEATPNCWSRVCIAAFCAASYLRRAEEGVGGVREDGTGRRGGAGARTRASRGRRSR